MTCALYSSSHCLHRLSYLHPFAIFSKYKKLAIKKKNKKNKAPPPCVNDLQCISYVIRISYSTLCYCEVLLVALYLEKESFQCLLLPL